MRGRGRWREKDRERERGGGEKRGKGQRKTEEGVVHILVTGVMHSRRIVVMELDGRSKVIAERTSL